MKADAETFPTLVQDGNAWVRNAILTVGGAAALWIPAKTIGPTGSFLIGVFAAVRAVIVLPLAWRLARRGRHA